MVRGELAPDVEMTSKKILRNQVDVACTPHFFEKNLRRRLTRSRNLQKKFRPGNYFMTKRCFWS